ncbi:hypothetical protein ACLMJK_002716 [Lecanora helva]
MPQPTSPAAIPPSNNDLAPDPRPPTPTAPPYSPITPVMSISLPATNHGSGPAEQNPAPHIPPSNFNAYNNAAFDQNTHHAAGQKFPQQTAVTETLPPPQPISISDNPDAIALRSAMSILQIQRQQALRDMKTLEAQKEKALEDPEGFARSVSKGQIKTRSMDGIVPAADERGDVNSDGDGGDGMDDGGDKQKPKGEGSQNDNSFGTIPSAQNVVRMPPINWAKYHVVGESLDQLHEEQRARPGGRLPSTNEDLRPRERSEESAIAAPYDPWTDRLAAKPPNERGAAKKKT